MLGIENRHHYVTTDYFPSPVSSSVSSSLKMLMVQLLQFTIH